MAGNPDFDVFKLPEEHDELRAVLRDLCEKEIAPYAADVDEKPRFPDEALKALNESGFSAVHVPEEYGGQGADSVATCIVIEEVARVCASSSLIPAVNKLGTMGLILSGSDDLKKQVLPAIGSGEAMASYRAGCVGRGDRIHQGPQAVGKPVSEFQGVQFMLADMAMKVEAAAVDGVLRGGARRAWRARPGLHLVGVEVLRLRRDDGGDHRRRAAVRWRGLQPRLPVERMMRDAKITQIYEGTNQIQRVVMSRALLR